MQDTTRACERAMTSVADMAQAIIRLPAVATLDWTDRAAVALTGLSSPCRSGVMICTVDPNGAVSDPEAAGIAARRASGLDADEQAVELTLRSRSERLDHIGFRVSQGQLESGVYGSLSELMSASDWRSRGLGRIWAGVPAGEVIAGVIGLDRIEPGRCLIAMVGVGTADTAAAGDLRVAQLRVIMPLLAARALHAIGERRTTASRWLTQREQQVLEQLTLGKSVRQIAEQIGRSPHTVHDHVKSLHRKLHASSRGELVARALGYLDEKGSVYAPDRSEAGPAPEIHTTGSAAAFGRPREAPSSAPAATSGSGRSDATGRA